MTNALLYKGELSSPSRYILTFHKTSYTLFLNSITDLIVRVLRCIQALFVAPRRFIADVPEVGTVTLEHSLPPLPLNRSHRTYHLVLEGGDRLLTATVQ